jgi:hypothetical protein
MIYICNVIKKEKPNDKRKWHKITYIYVSTGNGMSVMLYKKKKKSNDKRKWQNITYMLVSTHDDMYVMLKNKKTKMTK